MEKLQVYGIGNVLIDIITDNVPDDDLKQLGLTKGIMKLTTSKERETLLNYIKNRHYTYNCGGSAPNTIITLSSLGIKTGLSGIIGNDEFGEMYEERLKEHGVISFLTKAEGNTGSSIILVSTDSERTMNTSLEINREYSREHVQPEAIKEADYLYFTGYMWDTPSQKEALTSAIEIAKHSNTKIVFDLADPFAVQRSKPDFIPLIKNHCDIVFANHEEARILFDSDKLEQNINSLGELCEIAIIKNGSMGSLIKSSDHADIIKIPVYRVNAIDTTGAGDTYAAGFLYGLCSMFSLKDTGLFASFLASQIVTQLGAQFTIEKMKQIKNLIKTGKWKYPINS